MVPLGERLGVPSEQTVETNPSRCSPTTRFMSAVSIAVGSGCAGDIIDLLEF
jgi:hypothetical protein